MVRISRAALAPGAALLLLATNAAAANWYVKSDAAPGGDGGRSRPFARLADAEQRSRAGDSIFVVGGKVDGAITLKANQKLIGLAADGSRPKTGETLATLTNTTGAQGGVIVRLARGNEIAGIHFADMRNYAVLGLETDFSGLRLHDNLFTGSAKAAEPIYSVHLETTTGDIRNVSISNNTFRDGDDLGGVRVLHKGKSTGVYRAWKNTFNGLGGRAFHVHTMDDAFIRSQILDSTADNIGVGDRNSDSIIPYLMGRSRQQMLVSGWRYDNTRQVGNRSNTGMETFLFGWPREDEKNWCTACRLDLNIEKSVFANAVTDGIQFTNYGSNSVVNIVVRHTVVRGAKPSQAFGAIGMTGQKERGTGSRNTLLIENSDLISSSAFGFAVKDENLKERTTIVDLGGGPLGSKGGNRILSATLGAVRVGNANSVYAKNNWWGDAPPRVTVIGEGATVIAEPALKSDPRPMGSDATAMR